MESEAEEKTGVEMGKGSHSLIMQACPECLCAGREFIWHWASEEGETTWVSRNLGDG